jgi:hypothetical protein
MPISIRIAMGAAAAALAAWMIVLFTSGRSIEFRDIDSGETELAVRCQSLTGQADGSYHTGHLDGSTLTYRQTQGTLPEEGQAASTARRAVNDLCDRERTASAAMIGLLAVPAAILAALSLVSRPAG